MDSVVSLTVNDEDALLGPSVLLYPEQRALLWVASRLYGFSSDIAPASFAPLKTHVDGQGRYHHLLLKMRLESQGMECLLALPGSPASSNMSPRI